MSSTKSSSQRRAIKSLAKTPYSVFEEEGNPIVVNQGAHNNPEAKINSPVEDGVDVHSEDDVTMDDTDAPQCGFCGDYHEDWIQCDNEACTIIWYGLDCVGLTKAPAGKWLCTSCRPRPVFPNLPGAPKNQIGETLQQRPKGVATKKRNSNRTKPWWKGWVELSAGEKEKMQQEVDAQWDAVTLSTRTRTGTEVHARKQRRRLRRGIEREARIYPLVNTGEKQRSHTREEHEQFPDTVGGDHLAQEAAAALADQGRMPLLEAAMESGDGENMEDEEIEVSDVESSHRWDRESTFEGFSPYREMTDDIESGIEELSVVDEDEEIQDISSVEQLSVVDEDGEAESQVSGHQLAGDEDCEDLSSTHQLNDGEEDEELEDEESDEAHSENDLEGERAEETMGVGSDDYKYLDLSRYGPFLVRRS